MRTRIPSDYSQSIILYMSAACMELEGGSMHNGKGGLHACKKAVAEFEKACTPGHLDQLWKFDFALIVV